MRHDNFDWPTIERRSVQLQIENGCNPFLHRMREKSARGANSNRAAQNLRRSVDCRQTGLVYWTQRRLGCEPHVDARAHDVNVDSMESIPATSSVGVGCGCEQRNGRDGCQ
jgi:hypothetical protein